ncbi:MAG: SEC-C metal-binding domain-containing protein [Desulfobacterales bacterium]|nr:SEC-C metal-binding domain-containing protein [Desulfobacterales bacterium]
MQIGRNDPCPCGNGRKYKKCCLSGNVTTSVELRYRRLSAAHDRLAERLMKYAVKTFGKDIFSCALNEFWIWPEDDKEAPDSECMDRQRPLFVPWLLFNWEYDEFDEDFKLNGPPDRTVAELYAMDKGTQLEPMELALIGAVNRKPYSLWEVLKVEPGKGISLRDALTGAEISVEERSGSRYVKPADILFGRAVSVEGVGMLIGLAATVIPPRNKPEIIQLRNQIKAGLPSITDQDLYEHDVEIRAAFLDIDERLHRPPQICNTDGDPIEFHKIIYAVESPEEAFRKLASLCATDGKADLRETAEIDADGQIRRVEIPWNRKGYKGKPEFTNTLMGTIRIDGRKLSVEVNSAERAKKIRKEIQKRLGMGVRFKADRILELDAMAASVIPEKQKPERSAEQDELMQHPEIQAHMAEMMKRHWEGWVNMKLPALGGKTPKQAVKTADGREAVEALSADAARERPDDPVMGDLNRNGVRRAREILGLSKSVK